MKRKIGALLIVCLMFFTGFSACNAVMGAADDPVYPNRTPVAAAGGSYLGNRGQDIGFDGSQSSDPDGDSLWYRWDWTNDGTYDTAWSSSSTRGHSYSTAGNYTVKLQVKDEHDATDTDTEPVTVYYVNNCPNTPCSPSPKDGEYHVKTGKTLAWQCSDPDGDSLIYDVYFGTVNPPPGPVATVTTKSYNPGDLDYDIDYYWKIVAKDSEGAEESGPVWHFKAMDNWNLDITVWDTEGDLYRYNQGEDVHFKCKIENDGLETFQGTVRVYVWVVHNDGTGTVELHDETYDKSLASQGEWWVPLPSEDFNKGGVWYIKGEIELKIHDDGTKREEDTGSDGFLVKYLDDSIPLDPPIPT